VIVLNKGRIAQAGLPDDIYHRPQNEFVAEFLGLRNRLACTLAGGRISSAEHKIVSDGVALSEGEYILRFRPSAVSIHREAEGTIEAGRYLSLQGGKIVEVLHSGETIDYVLESNGTLFYAESRSKQSFARGERVTAQLHLSDARFFAAQSGELAHG
jgi:ABC-type Fe3+/spermidine/putrescine transport system ATPase subunit